jgi:hypothetical protein
MLSTTRANARMFWTALPLLAMALCMPAHAQQYCSNATLRGDFAVVITGQTGLPSTPVPRSGVAMTQFDGLGGVVDLDHIVSDGTQPPTDWRPGTGTYTVNSDCTGMLVVNFAAPAPPLMLFFVVGSGGNTFRGVVGAAGANVTADGIRLETSL